MCRKFKFLVTPLLTALLVVVSALTVLELGPRWEGKWLPVVKKFRVDEVTFDPYDIRISGTMNKVRDCRFLWVRAYITYAESPTWVERLDLNLLDEPTRMPRSRPVGQQAWGPWLIKNPSVNSPGSITVESIHSCHWAWQTVTILTVLGYEGTRREYYDYAD